MSQPTSEKFTPDDFSAHDLELITQWTGKYFGHPDADPYMLTRALFVLGKRRAGEDTHLKFEHTRPLPMKDISTWVDAHWDLDPDNSTADEVDQPAPKAGSSADND